MFTKQFLLGLPALVLVHAFGSTLPASAQSCLPAIPLEELQPDRAKTIDVARLYAVVKKFENPMRFNSSAFKPRSGAFNWAKRHSNA